MFNMLPVDEPWSILKNLNSRKYIEDSTSILQNLQYTSFANFISIPVIIHSTFNTTWLWFSHLSTSLYIYLDIILLLSWRNAPINGLSLAGLLPDCLPPWNRVKIEWPSESCLVHLVCVYSLKVLISDHFWTRPFTYDNFLSLFLYLTEHNPTVRFPRHFLAVHQGFLGSWFKITPNQAIIPDISVPIDCISVKFKGVMSSFAV